MFTDMVGFTSRTQVDETGSLALLREQEILVRPILAAHLGREVKSTGDGFLVEFPSALEAARCAVAIQERIAERNRTVPGPKIVLRIGIHLGDVEQQGDDIFGDAVNVAARVQPTADPGGISVSQQVYDQVQNKLGRGFDRLPGQQLKGLRQPIDIYRVRLAEPDSSESSGRTASDTNRIAVLPFSNISPDPSDAYLSDGLTEEVISVLSQLHGLRVIARTSVEPYKTAPKPVSQVGTELGVAWVLEGSVRKAGNRLRITAQLIEVASQEHRWAQTYDRELDDVFALQSEMAKEVAGVLEIKVRAPETRRLDGRSVPNSESYLAYLQGRTALHGATEVEMRQAATHFEHALSLDEGNAAAHAGLSDALQLLGGTYHFAPRSEWEASSRRHVRRALELDPDLAEAHTSHALLLWSDYDFAAAQKEFARAIALNPSFAWARLWHAECLADMFRPEESLQENALARELDPLSALVLAFRASLLIDLRRLDEAESVVDRLHEVEHEGFLYHDQRAGLCLARGDAEGFLREVDALSAALPGRPELTIARARYQVLRGDVDGAREAVRPLESLPEPTRPTQGLASLYSSIGDLDAAFRWIDVAVSAGRFSPRAWAYSPSGARLRADPRWAAVVRRLHLD